MRPGVALLAAALLASGPALAQDVAAVLLLQGDVEILDASGTRRAATLELGLVRSDTVITAEESAVILQLHNDHLVRVDEDLELTVSDIVLLDATPTSVSPQDQLASLLYPDERGTMTGDSERIAGWHARMTAAYAPKAISEADMEESARKQEDTLDANKAPMGRAAPAPPTSSAPMEPPPSPDPAGDAVYDFATDDVSGELLDGALLEYKETEEAPEEEPADDEGGDFADDEYDEDGYGYGAYGSAAPTAEYAEITSARPGRDKKPKKDKKKGGGGGAFGAPKAQAMEAPADPSAGAFDAYSARFAGPSPLRTCIDTWAAGLPVELQTVRFSLRLRDGAVYRVRVDQGLAAPLCARDALIGEVTTLPESELVFDLQLGK